MLKQNLAACIKTENKHSLASHFHFEESDLKTCLHEDKRPLYEASLVAQMVKNPPAMQQTWVRSLGQEDPLEEKMTTHSSTLAWEILWTEEPGGLQSIGSQSWARLSDSHTHAQLFIAVCGLLSCGT